MVSPGVSLLATILLTATLPASSVIAQDQRVLAESLIFHAPFDETLDARVGVDRRIATAESPARNRIQPGNQTSHVSLAPDAGRFGDALRFRGEGKQVVLFHGRNAGYRSEDWSGTVSFWLKLDPDKDLAPGFCDPLQMTDKTWNNSALWVDFDKELPRAFRLGVFSTPETWNPDDIPWDQFPVAERPMVAVDNPPFAADRWTHVVMVFDHINPGGARNSTAELYLDAVSQGRLSRPLRLDWEVDRAAIMLGIAYQGDMDDLAIFRRALSADEVRQLHELPRGVSGLAADGR